MKLKKQRHICVICRKRVAASSSLCCANCLLEKHLRELGCIFEGEYRFAWPKRRWRFDYLVGPPPSFYCAQFAIEIEGAIWAQGRHTRGSGYQKDLDKYNHATMMGYRVLRFSTEDILRGRARAFIKNWMEAKDA